MTSTDLPGEENRQYRASRTAAGGSEEHGAASRQGSTRPLDFDVVIATRNRPSALALSIPLILGQSRQPQKLIVIDSSDDHATVADTVATAVAAATTGGGTGAGTGAGAGWNGTVIVEHTGRGSAYQRNRGLEHVEAEVVIFPDDDSLFHPGTSAAIMRAYERDAEGRIVGVCAADAGEPPPGALAGEATGYAAGGETRGEAAAPRPHGRRRRKPLGFDGLRPSAYVGNLLKARAEPPDWLEAENCGLVDEMWGYRMSFRTAVIRANPFDETLRNYALFEDLDACLAAMRQGSLVCARNARIFHHTYPRARVDHHTLGLIRLLNRSYVTLKHAHDAGLAPAEEKRARRLVRQYCGLMVLSRLPRLHHRSDREELRGVLAAFEGVRAMLAAPREDLSRVYSEAFARRAP